MITCSICNTNNDEFAVICTNCKGYLQARVQTLDLFRTFWQLMESPSLAFRRIVLSEHKNYVFLLSGLGGVSMMYAAMWWMKVGPEFSNLAALAGTGLGIGIPAGILVVYGLSFVVRFTARLMRGTVGIKNAFAVLAYACSPLVFALVLIFPLEVAIFGLDFFGSNPPPAAIKPFEYNVLIGLDAAAVLWCAFLMLEGIRVVSGLNRAKAMVVLLAMVAVLTLGSNMLHLST